MAGIPAQGLGILPEHLGTYQTKMQTDYLYQVQTTEAIGQRSPENDETSCRVN